MGGERRQRALQQILLQSVGGYVCGGLVAPLVQAIDEQHEAVVEKPRLDEAPHVVGCVGGEEPAQETGQREIAVPVGDGSDPAAER